MVHIGSFVPADNATVALTDRIFTAITNIDSVNIIQSTFAQDLAHVATMLQHATAKSLLLIDEFGNGTAPPIRIRMHSYVINKKQNSLPSRSCCL